MEIILPLKRQHLFSYQFGLLPHLYIINQLMIKIQKRIPHPKGSK